MGHQRFPQCRFSWCYAQRRISNLSPVVLPRRFDDFQCVRSGLSTRTGVVHRIQRSHISTYRHHSATHVCCERSAHVRQLGRSLLRRPRRCSQPHRQVGEKAENISLLGTYSVNPSKLDPGSSNFRQLGYCLSDFRRVHRICTCSARHSGLIIRGPWQPFEPVVATQAVAQELSHLRLMPPSNSRDADHRESRTRSRSRQPLLRAPVPLTGAPSARFLGAGARR